MESSYYERNKVSVKRRVRDRKIKIKATIVGAYGGKCVRCGESRLGCLELDHINNDGAMHRKLVGQRGNSCNDKIYQWLIKNSFPEGFQILCANCHQLKHCTYPEKDCIASILEVCNGISA